MLAKRTVKNQITLPKKIASLFPEVDYFDVETKEGKIILMPLKTNGAEKVREKLSKLNLSDHTISEAIHWARKHKS